VKGLGVKMKKHKGNFKVQFGARIASIFAVVAIFGFTVQAAASNTTYSTSSGTTYTIDGTDLDTWTITESKEFIAPKSGIYNFKIYGAQGGNYQQEETTYTGGKGSYVNVTLALNVEYTYDEDGEVTDIQKDSVYLAIGNQGVQIDQTLEGGALVQL
jgi:hypothetical protein